MEVYSPIPEIESYSEWDLKWKVIDKNDIESKLSWEPINLYRYRAWSLEKIKDVNDKDITFSLSWDYSFTTKWETKWLVLSNAELDIAKINEHTWLITLENNSNSNIKVNTTKKYPEIIINNWEKDIYSQVIKFIKKLSIIDVPDFNNIDKEWIYIKLNDTTTFEKFIVPKWVVYNPWAYIIYKKSDTSSTPILAVFEDWRITVSPSYKLIYWNYWNYIDLKLVDSSDTSVADILYKVDLSYVLK
jgi:hypothetical protein